MANKVQATRAGNKRTALERRRKKALLGLLDLDLNDRAAVKALLDAHTADYHVVETRLMMIDAEAAKRLVSLAVDCLLSESIEARIRLRRVLSIVEHAEISTEERRAFLVRIIEIARDNFIQQCRQCGGWTSSEVCELCGAPATPDCGWLLSRASELDTRFADLDPDSVACALKRWRSCTLVAAKLSILAGTFDDSGDPRAVQRRFDLAYRKVFGRAPASFRDSGEKATSSRKTGRSQSARPGT